VPDVLRKLGRLLGPDRRARRPERDVAALVVDALRAHASAAHLACRVDVREKRDRRRLVRDVRRQRRRDVAVVGGGDTAVSDALYLSRFAKSVKVIHRRDALRASETLQKAAFSDEKIEFIWNSVPKELIGEDRLTGVVIENTQTRKRRKIDAEGIFIAVGIEPKSALVKGLLELTPEGYIRTDCIMQTSEKGVYAAGDVRDTPLRQVVTAVADGAVAATKAVEYLTA
jgi:thioredoxin reductase (NADPH)